MGRVKESLSAEEIILSKDSDEQQKWRYGDEREGGGDGIRELTTVGEGIAEDGIGELTAVVGEGIAEGIAEDGIIVQGFTVKI